MVRLEGKTAIITGAGRGIGRAIAHKLAAEGASVVVNDLDATPANEVVDEITLSGGKAVACPGSVSAAEFAEQLIGAATQNFGGIDIIVNNAGYGWGNPIQRMTDEQWDAMIDVHLKAPFRILRAAQPVISRAVKAENDAGQVVHRKVVNVSSILGVYGGPVQANYSAAKAGIIGLTKTLAKEWGRYRVNVNGVAFGFIETRLTATTTTTVELDGRKLNIGIDQDHSNSLIGKIPLGRAGTTDEAAGAVAILTYPESDYINGQILVVSGGLEG
ncbi:SDR family NAD(P)-dependent oxidoreductase [Saccharopolyspora elongata]|uniref:SDR family oxidoreductase n=1 Tax=Saccharopolyspora elongata TaxID=2530387 RepID=A0A4R4YCE9_9PSEU|nr:SDR family NAD(P)-dependent oxidoreductase [Saccharopolyspora elongata]TDD42186.1 SDR family oxidoreductase [Saccharopolyspora elongata]